MAKFEAVFSNVERPKTMIKTSKVQMIHYTKIVESAYQYRTRTDEQVRRLAELIQTDGEILEPVIIRKSSAGGDTYEIISGHKRTLAAKYLVEEENLLQFAFVPCVEKTLSDVRAEFAVYSTNGYDEKTPYEIMKEIEGMTFLLKNYPEEFPEISPKGRLVEKLAKQLNMSRSVVSDYQNISHNLGDAGMEAFASGQIDKSAAVALSSLKESEQEEAIRSGCKTRSDIQQFKKESEENTTEKPKEETPEDEQIEGQDNILNHPEWLPEKEKVTYYHIPFPDRLVEQITKMYKKNFPDILLELIKEKINEESN